MTLTGNQLDALRELEDVWPGSRAVVIGASALGFYYDMWWRHTADVDLVMAIDLEDFPGDLVERPGWSRHPRKEHELTSPQGVRLDVLPASDALIEKGEIRWPGGQLMNLAGMDLAFQHAELHEVANRTVLVAPPSVIGILKMASYCDRPLERERDLSDIAHLLDAYVDDDSDRRFDEAVGQEFELAPSYLFGIDVRRVAERDSHRALINRFLEMVVDPASTAHLVMRREGPTRWRSSDDLARRLTAFRAGLDHPPHA